jgi:hypothetical protein
MSMTRDGIVNRAVMPPTERATLQPGESALAEVHAELAAEYAKEATPGSVLDFAKRGDLQSQSLVARQAEETARGKVLLACTYAAYGIKPGEAQALANAQQRRRPGLVLIRMKNGSGVTCTCIDDAVQAICGGWATLEV